MVNATLIRELCHKQGFDLCGVTHAKPLTENRVWLERWLTSGESENLEYMGRYKELRLDPSLLLNGAKSVIVCAMNYKNEYSLTQHNTSTPHIASYATCYDYHKTIRKRLKRVLKALQEHYPTLCGRCFVDSAPLLEKQLALNAGLGWIGRQGLLVTPEFGSFVLLGEIVIDYLVDSYNTPYTKNGCGTCRLCIDTCPTKAISEVRTIDSRRCISCRTVEVENNSDITLAGWVFGCDECQSCCPHNQNTPLYQNQDFKPIVSPISSQEWRKLNDTEFLNIFGATPLKRAGLNRIIKSVK